MIKWEIVKDKTEEYWLEVKGDDGSRVWAQGAKEKDGKPIYPMNAVCKFDGCIHFYQYSNSMGYGHKCDEKCRCMKEYLHICDIDSMIEALQELKKIVVKFYKGKTGKEKLWLEEPNIYLEKK